MKVDLHSSASAVVSNLRELANLTSDEHGAQRVAWTPLWQKARNWFADKARSYGAEVMIDAAGNTWAKIPGRSSESIVMGSHLDCVPNGGWLDGCYGVVAALEAIRYIARNGVPARTVYAVDWADEEGARFGRSLVGVSAAAGTMDVAELINRVDNNGRGIKEVLAENGVDLENCKYAFEEFKQRSVYAYLELHIEQGPVLEQTNKTVACVYGITGVERHYIRFEGQPAHAGSFPTLMRQDAFLAAAQAALAFREIALKYEGVCTVGKVSVEPDVVTIVPGTCVISLDQRSIDKDKLARMYAEAQQAVEKSARDHSVKASWEKIWAIDPTVFDAKLTKMCKEAVQDETGEPTTIYSGPLHDAAEMAKLVPSIMMFAMSERGLSHCPEENTPDVALESASRAFFRLAEKVVNQ